MAVRACASSSLLCSIVLSSFLLRKIMKNCCGGSCSFGRQHGPRAEAALGPSRREKYVPEGKAPRGPARFFPARGAGSPCPRRRGFAVPLEWREFGGESRAVRRAHRQNSAGLGAQEGCRRSGEHFLVFASVSCSAGGQGCAGCDDRAVFPRISCAALQTADAAEARRLMSPYSLRKGHSLSPQGKPSAPPRSCGARPEPKKAANYRFAPPGGQQPCAFGTIAAGEGR